ncbi:MAG: adenosylcobinamide-GDP ribazoletransferase [Ferroplasma sp.]|uniref:adenosylcobinamide-GDP ribazoletransferase n=1 Tax=Ferroplasma sp. TaxID=2591003 RepID=UPI002815DFB2|nr:adenosylcobinamide-GDP ribazoletransferase [Ferroplasma sp.]WMT51891.1 MAG: adenosylcobinamide-GDP ribazoletransferase [Ferroplasma sp.]
MNKYIEGFLSAISFFTLIPAGGKYEISRHTMYFFTIAGLVTGLIAGIPYLLLSPYSPFIASAIAVSIIVIIYGFNHFDSIMDFGDSFMVRGTEAKQRVIKDRYTGSGGIGMVFIIYVPAIAFLTFFNPLSGFMVIISGEMVSKYATLISMYRSKPFGTGIGSMFISLVGTWSVLLNLIPLALIAFFNLYNIGIASGVLITAYAIKRGMEKQYGGINGDLIGSVGEISRTLFYFLSFIFVILHLNLFLL